MKKLFSILLFIPLVFFGQTLPQIGDEAYGGIVFYVDETGLNGLVAATEDLIGDDSDYFFEWGCWMEFVSGADAKWIGAGLQNTMDIINQGCQTEYGGLTAAQAVLDAEINGYSDWYLPSQGELFQMFITIGESSENGNIGALTDNWYWSSSEYDDRHAWGVYFINGYTNGYYNYDPGMVRPIRTFTINDLTIGCPDSLAANYHSSATEDDGSCVYSEDILQNAVSSIYEVLNTWNTSIYLTAGWNMFGYGCPEPLDVIEGLSNHTESIIIVKDYNGAVYMPEFDFNGVGDLIPGAGYQMKLNQPIEGFSLCDWYVNDIPEDNIVSLQEENASLQVFVDSVNAPTIYQVGDYAKGGIVFYIDETGQHGLVATLDDLEGNDPYDWGYGGFEWGCVDLDVNNATGWDIGTGRQNTLGIVNAMCTTINNGNSAALQSIITESNGYYDWYLPSIEELVEMYDMIGNGSLLGNIGNFYIGNGDTNSGCGYWSSTQYSYTHSRALYFNVGEIYESQKQSTNRVRPIRSF